MQFYRLLFILFFSALAVISLGWPQTWPVATEMAVMFYGFWHWLGPELTGWLSVILAVLARTDNTPAISLLKRLWQRSPL